MRLIPILRHECRLLLVAIQFLTRLPTPSLKDWQDRWLQDSTRYFPLTGLLVGVLTAGVFWLLSCLFNPWVAAIGSTAFSVRLTGAFHEDGLADTCDGLGGGLTRERALMIMKDSRLGTYGTLGLVLTLLLKTALLASLPLATALVSLVLAHGFSRLAAILLLTCLPYAGDPKHAKAKPLASSLQPGQAAYALLTLLPLLLLVLWLEPGVSLQLLPAFALLLLISFYLARLLQRRLGGFTGDGLGATQQLAELAFYLGMAITWP